MSSDQFIDELGAELDRAAQRRHEQPSRRPRRVGVIAAVAASIVVLVGVIGFGTTREASADVEVIRRGDELYIRLLDVETRPEEIERAAREAGVDIRVVEAPVGVSNVGRFVGGSSSGGAEQLEVIDGDERSGFDGVRVPVDFDGSLLLELGRPAAEGEMWRLASQSNTRGEPMECIPAQGRSVGDVLADARRIGLEDVSVRVVDDPGGPNAHTEDLERFADAEVLSVENFNPTDVEIHAVWERSSVPPQPDEELRGCR